MKKTKNSPVFSPNDMEKRWKRLKAQGYVPVPTDVLCIIQRIQRKSLASTAEQLSFPFPFSDADREWLGRMGITDRDDA